METHHEKIRALTPSQIDEVFEQTIIARLGVYSAGEVYVVPVTLVKEGDFLYGHSRLGKKIQMMRANPKVCIQLDQIRDLFSWRSVVVQARYEELSELEAARGMRILIQRIAQDQRERNLTPLEIEISAILSKAIIYRFRIEQISARSEG